MTKNTYWKQSIWVELSKINFVNKKAFLFLMSKKVEESCHLPVSMTLNLFCKSGVEKPLNTEMES